jgi:hypothetical protein
MRARCLSTGMAGAEVRTRPGLSQQRNEPPPRSEATPQTTSSEEKPYVEGCSRCILPRMSHRVKVNWVSESEVRAWCAGTLVEASEASWRVGLPPTVSDILAEIREFRAEWQEHRPPARRGRVKRAKSAPRPRPPALDAIRKAARDVPAGPEDTRRAAVAEALGQPVSRPRFRRAMGPRKRGRPRGNPRV